MTTGTKSIDKSVKKEWLNRTSARSIQYTSPTHQQQEMLVDGYSVPEELQREVHLAIESHWYCLGVR